MNSEQKILSLVKKYNLDVEYAFKLLCGFLDEQQQWLNTPAKPFTTKPKTLDEFLKELDTALKASINQEEKPRPVQQPQPQKQSRNGTLSTSTSPTDSLSATPESLLDPAVSRRKPTATVDIVTNPPPDHQRRTHPESEPPSSGLAEATVYLSAEESEQYKLSLNTPGKIGTSLWHKSWDLDDGRTVEVSVYACVPKNLLRCALLFEGKVLQRLPPMRKESIEGDYEFSSANVSPLVLRIDQDSN